jgi:hypothetical protein
MKKGLLSILLLGGILLGEKASAQFTLTGQYRPRTELRNGFKTPVTDGQEVASFTEQRTRLIAGYKSGRIETKFSIQDVRIWGQVGTINKSDNLLSVHEAYAVYKLDSLGKGRLIIGRQELNYDDQRVLGSLDWASQARSFDALKYAYKHSDSTWVFHAIGSYNQDATVQEPSKLQNSNVGTGGNYYNGGASGSFNQPLAKAAVYLWFNTKLKHGKMGDISLISMNEGYQESVTLVSPLFTEGITPTLIFGKIKVHGAFYYQAGKSQDSITISAYLAHLEVTHTGSKFKPTIGFDYVSGDNKKTKNKIEGFNPLYGTNHKFYGYMDYFYVGNGHNGGANGLSGGLVDIYAKAVLPIAKSILSADLHFFMSPTDVLNPANKTQKLSAFLGTELDLTWSKQLSDGVGLTVGYSQLLHTESMSAIKGKLIVDPTNPTKTVDQAKAYQSWAYIMINFTPKFL